MGRMNIEKVLIVGNGSTNISKNECRVAAETGKFLEQLSGKLKVIFVQGAVSVKSKQDILSSDISKVLYKVVSFNKNRPIAFIRNWISTLILLFDKAVFVYLFFPGSYSKIFGQFCNILNKPYGIYIRGEIKESKINRQLLKNAEFSLSVSKSLSNIAYKHGCKNCSLIKPMVSIPESFDSPNRTEKSKNSTFKIIFVGRLEREKGILELLDAVDSLYVLGEKILLTIVGGGDLYDYILKCYGSKEYIKITGSLCGYNEIKPYYEDSDIFILPSRSEGFPRVLYEAMVNKVAIVTTFVGSIPDLMIDQYNCYKLCNTSKESIEETVLAVIRNPEKITYITNNALTTYRDRLSLVKLSHDELLVEKCMSYAKDK